MLCNLYDSTTRRWCYSLNRTCNKLCHTMQLFHYAHYHFIININKLWQWKVRSSNNICWQKLNFEVQLLFRISMSLLLTHWNDKYQQIQFASPTKNWCEFDSSSYPLAFFALNWVPHTLQFKACCNTIEVVVSDENKS